jgi:hypothetical protein
VDAPWRHSSGSRIVARRTSISKQRDALIALRSCLALDSRLPGGHCLAHIGRREASGSVLAVRTATCNTMVSSLPCPAPGQGLPCGPVSLAGRPPPPRRPRWTERSYWTP